MVQKILSTTKGFRTFKDQQLIPNQTFNESKVFLAVLVLLWCTESQWPRFWTQDMHTPYCACPEATEYTKQHSKGISAQLRHYSMLRMSVFLPYTPSFIYTRYIYISHTDLLSFYQMLMLYLYKRIALNLWFINNKINKRQGLCLILCSVNWQSIISMSLWGCVWRRLAFEAAG